MRQDLAAVNRISGLAQDARICLLGGKRGKAAEDLGAIATEAKRLAGRLAREKEEKDGYSGEDGPGVQAPEVPV